jgi:hypothetical protein
MKLLILAAALAAGPALADSDWVFKQGGDTVRLSDSPCVHGGTLAQLAPQWRPKFRKAAAVVGGKQFYACWIADQNGVYVLFEDGEEPGFRLKRSSATTGL